MNFRVLRALFWKDYRVHRPVLVLGGVLLLLPYFGGLLGILLADRESTAAWIEAESLVGMSFASLVLSMVTMIGLAGSAFAAEHEDRASEFLACLPTTRWLALSSKILLMAAVVASVSLANLIPLFFLKPHLSDASGLTGELGALRLLAAIGPLLFGAAWLASAWLRQSTVASICGLAAPFVVAAVIRGLHIATEPASFAFGAVYGGVCLTLGLGSFVAGCAVYLVRFEP